MMQRWAFLVVIVLITGCDLLSPSSDQSIQQIPAPKSDYSGVAWLPDGELVLSYSDPNDFTPRLMQLQPDGKDPTELQLSQELNCIKTEYRRPTALPDGRLGLIKSCFDFPPPKGRGALGDKTYVMAYDMKSGEIKMLVAKPVGHSELNNPAISQFTWDPLMERGLLGAGGGLFNSIAWLTREGLEYATITIEDGNRRWRLDEEFHEDPGHPSPGLGNADWPTWSPDGRTIAFTASPQAIGVDGFARLDVPWNLYLMDPVEQKPRKVLSDIKEPRSLVWSPDSRWLAFRGEFSLSKKGMWLFEPSSNTLHQVTSKAVSWLAWSPDGKQIVGIYDPDPNKDPREAELWRFDVSKIVSSK